MRRLAVAIVFKYAFAVFLTNVYRPRRFVVMRSAHCQVQLYAQPHVMSTPRVSPFVLFACYVVARAHMCTCACRVPDNEIGSHTLGCVLTEKRPLLRRGVYKAKNICMAFCMDKCAVSG